jgi:hypothetical protein
MDKTTAPLSPERPHTALSPKPGLQGRRLVIGLVFVLAINIALYAFVLDISAVGLPIPILVIIIAIISIREHNADEVYLLWFVFFFLFYVTIGMYYFFDAQHVLEWHTFDNLPEISQSNKESPLAAGLSPSSIQRIWSAHGLKPHLVKTFKLSRDPHFAAKVEDVVGLYLNPPEKALVCCGLGPAVPTHHDPPQQS